MQVFKKKQVRDAYDRMAPAYDTAYTSSADLAENDLVRKALEPHVVGLRRVIDVGCGTGLLLELHKVPPQRYVGLDLSPGMLDRAAVKFPSHCFMVSDMEEPWPVPAASADSVVSLFGSFNYSLEACLTVDQIARALIPGGRFFLILYGERWPTRHSFVEGQDGTRQLYSPEAARKLFARPEFMEVRVRGLSRWVDRVRRAPLPVAKAALNAEYATVLRAAPDKGYFLVVEGRRTAHVE